MEMPRVSVQNIVATVKLSCNNVNLKTLMESAKNVEYKPNRFSAAIMRIREPRTTALIFKTGKLVVTGAKTEGDSKLASRKFARIIGKIMHCEVKIMEHKVTNIVGSCDLGLNADDGYSLNLFKLTYSNHSRFIKYEPEEFPGLVYNMKQPRLVFLIFTSGKVVIAGAKKVEDLQTAFDNLYPVLQEHIRYVPQRPKKVQEAPEDYPVEQEHVRFVPPPRVQDALDMEMDWEDLDMALSNV